MRNNPLKMLGSLCKTALFNSPYTAVVEVTGKCNLRCKTCSIWKTFDFQDASAKKFIETINFFEKQGLNIAMITGGEPLLRPDLKEIMQGINTTNMLLTNGYLLNEKINAISEYTDFVMVSLDSPIAKEHNAIRGIPNAFEKTLLGIKKTTEIGLPVHLVMTVTNSNINQIEKMCELSKDLNCVFSTNYLINLNPAFKGKAVYFNNENQEAPVDDYINLAKKMQKKYRNFATTDFELNLLKKGGNKINNPICKAGKTVIGIKPNAKIAFPCTHYTTKFLSCAEWKKANPLGGKMPFCEGCQIKCHIQPSIASQPLKWLSSYSFRDLTGLFNSANALKK